MLPPVVGALLKALSAITVTVAVSVPPMLSVTVSVTVPLPEPGGWTVAEEVAAPESIVAPLLAAQR